MKETRLKAMPERETYLPEGWEVFSRTTPDGVIEGKVKFYGCTPMVYAGLKTRRKLGEGWSEDGKGRRSQFVVEHDETFLSDDEREAMAEAKKEAEAQIAEYQRKKKLEKAAWDEAAACQEARVNSASCEAEKIALGRMQGEMLPYNQGTNKKAPLSNHEPIWVWLMVCDDGSVIVEAKTDEGPVIRWAKTAATAQEVPCEELVTHQEWWVAEIG